MICTGGYYPYHYKSVEFHNEAGYSYIIKEYGWHHTFYLIIVALYMILPVLLCVHAFFNKNKASYIHTNLLSMCQIVSIGLFFVEAIVGLNFELLPFSYNVSEIIILVIIKRTALYDVSSGALAKLTQSQGYGYLVLDTNKRYIGCDDTVRRVFPQVEEFVIDREITEPFFRHEFGSWVEESRTSLVEPKYFSKFGRDYKVTSEPFYDKKRNKQIGFIIEIYDDTKNQSYIRNVKKVNDELINANAELEVMSQKAFDANQAKSQFLSLMSHEIRTPINAVLGMNEMITKETTDANIAEYSADIRSSGTWLLSLINDILDFSKIEAGKMEVISRDYDIKNILRDIRNMSETRAKGKALSMEYDIDPDTPSVMNGDEVKIRQIIINLITNAIKYTDEGTVSLIVKTEKTSDDETMLRISVKDTGRGITKEGLENLFTVFTRADEAKNAGIEGTGLGLSISKSYAELMGGRIIVESEYGKGSTFILEIPQKIVDESPIGSNIFKPIGIVKRKLENITLAKRHIDILAVDDVDLNLKLFTFFLKKEDVTVDKAKNGPDSIELASRKKYDIIFMDQMMPGMNGTEALKHILNDEASINKETPIVVLTADAIAGVKEEYLKEGFTDYMSKPFTSDQLYEMINKFVE